jgi:hypothetical protein
LTSGQILIKVCLLHHLIFTYMSEESNEKRIQKVDTGSTAEKSESDEQVVVNIRVIQAIINRLLVTAGPFDIEGLTFEDVGTAKVLAGCETLGLSFDDLQTLNTEVAAELAKFKGKYLYFRGLTTLDAEAAARLAEFNGEGMSFDSLEIIDAEAAAALGKSKCELRINLEKLKELNAEAAAALACFEGEQIDLSGLEALNTETATGFIEFSGYALHLGIRTLDAETAAVIAKFKAKSLIFRGLTTLNTETAAALSDYKGKALSLYDINKMSKETAQALMNFKGKIHCTALREHIA